MAFNDDDRRAIFTVNSGELSDNGTPDILHIRSLRGAEAISSPFRFDLVLVTTDSAVNTGQLVGQNVTISLLRNLDLRDTADPEVEPYRYINGIVANASQVWTGGEDTSLNQLFSFSVEVVPDTWNLKNTFQSRVFHQMTAWDIAAQIVPDTSESIDMVDLGRSRNPGPRGTSDKYEREHCIQYRETDLDFVSRLLEEEG